MSFVRFGEIARPLTIAALAAFALAPCAVADETPQDQLRRTGMCERCDLRLSELRGLSLEKAELMRAVLREADLKEAVLHEADLRRPTCVAPSLRRRTCLVPISLVPRCGASTSRRQS